MNAMPSRLAAFSLICALAIPCARAGCNTKLSLGDTRLAFDESIYDDQVGQQAEWPIRWYSGDPATLAISLDADFRRTDPQPGSADLVAALAQVEVTVLDGDNPAASLEALKSLEGAPSAAWLAAPPPGALVPCEWSTSSPEAHGDGRGIWAASVRLTLREPHGLPDGSYWVVARIPLAPNGSLGCPQERGWGLFTEFVRLVVGPAPSLRERALREYRDVIHAQWSAATEAATLESPSERVERVGRELDFALDAAKRLVDVDRSSSFGWEMLGKIHDSRHEALPAIAAYRKAAELLEAGVPDIATLSEAGCGDPVMPRPKRLQRRIDALSLRQPVFADGP